MGITEVFSKIDSALEENKLYFNKRTITKNRFKFIW